MTQNASKFFCTFASVSRAKVHLLLNMNRGLKIKKLGQTAGYSHIDMNRGLK